MNPSVIQTILFYRIMAYGLFLLYMHAYKELEHINDEGKTSLVSPEGGERDRGIIDRVGDWLVPPAYADESPKTKDTDTDLLAKIVFFEAKQALGAGEKRKWGYLDEADREAVTWIVRN